MTDPGVVDDDNIDEMPWIFTSTARKLMFVMLALVVAVQALIVSLAVLLSFSPTLLLLVKHRQHRQDDADPADRGEPQTLRWGLPAVVGLTAAAASAAWRWPPADDYDRWFDTLLWLQAFTSMWFVASMVSLWRAPRSGWLRTHAIKVLIAQAALLMGSTLIGVAVLVTSQQEALRQALTALTVGCGFAALCVFVSGGAAGLRGLAQGLGLTRS